MAVAQPDVLRELCEEQWSAVDQQVADALNLQSWKTPVHLHEEVYARFRQGPALNVSSYRLARLSDRQALAQVFQHYAFPTAKAAAQAALHVVANVDDRTLAAIRRKVSFTGVRKTLAKRPARMRNADARNLELLSFVVERIIPFGQLQKRRLVERRDGSSKDVRLLPGHRGPKVIPLDALTLEWNASHPHWLMSEGRALYKQFARAANRNRLCDELLQRLKHSVDEAWQQLMEQATTPAQGLEELLAPDRLRPERRFPVRQSPSSWHDMDLDTWWAWSEMKPEEDALGLADLVQRRVEAIFDRAIHGEPVTDLRDLPLRMWWSAKPVTLAEQVARQNAVNAELALTEPSAKPTRASRTSRRPR